MNETTASRHPPRNWSIVAWGVAGVAAVVLSYLFAVALALACLAIPVVAFDIVMASSGSFLFTALLLSLFGLVVGLTILWSLLPRRENFDPAGVPIDLAKEPRLTDEIRSIASALNEPLPAEVYLIPDANAFVAQPGGSIRGRRKVLAFGLPLLQTLTVSEFRALLAHEFAHFYSGDTRLGPWVYKARTAMVRVYNNLGKKSDVLGLLTRWVVIAVPYMLLMGGLRLFWTLFMRLTQLISRRQEFRSDEIACYIAGSTAFAQALKKLPKTQAALGTYWNQVVLPVAVKGFQPQIADGFGRFLAAPNIAKASDDFLQKQMENNTTKPYDTHPPLSARLAKVEKLGVANPEDDTRAARDLFDHLDLAEADLLRKLVPAIKTAVLTPMAWETAGPEVYVPMWRKEVAPFQPLLAQHTLNSLPDLVRDSKAISDKVLNPPGILLSRGQRDERANSVLSMALALTLVDHGWTLHTQPGSWFLQRGATKLVPSNVIAALRGGSAGTKNWADVCAKEAFGECPLA